MSDNQATCDQEAEQLRARIAALEQLLEAHEKTVGELAARLEQSLQRLAGGQFFVFVRALVMGFQIQRTLEPVLKERAQQAHVVDFPLSDRPPLATVGARVPPGIPQMNVIDAFIVEMVVAVGTRPFAGTVGVVRIPEEAQVRNCLEQARGFRSGFCRGSSDVFQQENAAGRARNRTGLLQVLHDAINTVSGLSTRQKLKMRMKRVPRISERSMARRRSASCS